MGHQFGYWNEKCQMGDALTIEEKQNLDTVHTQEGFCVSAHFIRDEKKKSRHCAHARRRVCLCAYHSYFIVSLHISFTFQDICHVNISSRTSSTSRFLHPLMPERPDVGCVSRSCLGGGKLGRYTVCGHLISVVICLLLVFVSDEFWGGQTHPPYTYAGGRLV